MDLVSLTEIAQRAGVARITAYKWQERPAPGFPQPLAELAIGRVWEWKSVKKWLEKTGRLK